MYMCTIVYCRYTNTVLFSTESIEITGNNLEDNSSVHKTEGTLCMQ